MTGGRLGRARRVVVKIGSVLLVEGPSGRIRQAWLEALALDVAAMRADGKEVLIVTSGAIAIGRRLLALPPKGLRLEEQQAAAASGQIRLAHAYQEALGRHGLATAQLLLTLDDTESRRRHLNARGTIATLLRLGVIPVINENDTVATAEIRFGDNDRLAARVAQMAEADVLVLLSDIDGLYDRDPRTDPDARLVPEVAAVTPAIEAMAGAIRPGDSSGGMVTKLIAARIAQGAGCHMVIADGREAHPLRAIAAGARATWFLAQVNPRTARKRWIAGAIKPNGALVVDAGAVAALLAGKSLLPAGVVRVAGSFERGDAVCVTDPGGHEMARGLSAYAHADAARIAGHKSREIEAILGYRGREEMIHRDDLVLIER
ncbi:MAG: glutamate 5-kinase [Alphaproteobacteria bacterium]